MSQIIESVWLFDEKYRRYGSKRKPNSGKYFESVMEHTNRENREESSILKETKIKKSK